MKTKIVIVGAGPAGMLLSQILHQSDVDHVIVERKSKQYVLSRVRAGILEWNSVEVIRAAGVGSRMDSVGAPHDEVNITWAGKHTLPIRLFDLTAKQMMAYGQTELQEDLYAAAEGNGTDLRFEAADVALHDIESDTPAITFGHNGISERIECDFVAGCDGFHGPSRAAIPDSVRTEYEKVYPFGWLGVLSETPPLAELHYANHERGFALCSTRNPMLSRYYVQCPLSDSTDDWSDDRFWTELKARLPPEVADAIVTGPAIEKSIAPLRSFVAEPMRHGNLFLAGDSAHIVPPTGAKGLNLAISDVHLLSQALISHYATGDDSGLENYSQQALVRVWDAVRFSWSMTTLLHRFPEMTDFDQRIQERELAYLARSEAAQTTMAEQYVGLPFATDRKET